jgi:hypothetical protein
MLDSYSFSPEREVDFYFGDTEITAQFLRWRKEDEKYSCSRGKFFSREGCMVTLMT